MKAIVRCGIGVAAAAAAVLAVFAEGTNAVAATMREDMEDFLYAWARADDDLTDGEAWTPTFEQYFGRYGKDGAFPREAVVSNLCAIARDYAADGTRTNYRCRVVFDQAVFNIARFCLPEASNTVEYVFANVEGVDAYCPACAYARLHGLGHGAFEKYYGLMAATNMASSAKRSSLLVAVLNLVRESQVPENVTNRTCGLCLESVRSQALVSVDPELCWLWRGYETSSNRLLEVERILGLPAYSSLPQFLNVRTQLLALPPGTMQMLSTNQFCNVED